MYYIPPMRPIYAIILAAAAAPAFAANYATCVLDKMPGVANDVAAHSVYQLCLQEHPGGLAAVPQGSGRGFFGYNSGAECTAKKAGETRSQQAAYMINGACRKLYDEYHAGLRPFTGKLDGE